jgi:hypothetical protein
MTRGAHPFGLLNVSQACLEPAAAAVVVAALKFLQSKDSGSQRFDSV